MQKLHEALVLALTEAEKAHISAGAANMTFRSACDEVYLTNYVPAPGYAYIFNHVPLEARAQGAERERIETVAGHAE